MIKHIYVVDVSGFPVYVRCVGHDMCPLGRFDTIAVSGLLAALNNLSRDVGGGGLQVVSMEKAKFLLKSEPNFFIAFQVDHDDKVGKYQKDLNSLSNFILTVYSKSAPNSDKDRLKIIPKIESFIDESGLLTETQGLLGRIKSASSKILKK